MPHPAHGRRSSGWPEPWELAGGSNPEPDDHIPGRSDWTTEFGFRRTRLRRLTGAWAGLGIFAYNLHRMTVLSR
nr:hypothetical protein OG999_00210 [Streptomyces sp. NBC_00886]WSY58143.1 hypothetical protein OG999_50380 [Streptomyces sp. NBC_00886]